MKKEWMVENNHEEKNSSLWTLEIAHKFIRAN